MKKIRNLSIRNSILIAILFIVGTGLITVSLFNYNIFFGTTNMVVETTSREINKQIILNYENYIDDVIDIANYIQQETIELSKEDDTEGLNNSYLYATEIEKSIVSIVLYNHSGIPIYSSNEDEVFSQTVLSETWFQSALSDSTIFHFSSPHIQDIYLGGDKEVVTVTKVVEYYYNSESVDGILAIELETSNFYDLSEKTNLGESGHIVIVDEKNNLVHSSSDDCRDATCESLDIIQEIILGGEFVTVNNIDMYANVNTLQYTRWSIATFINVESISEAKQTVIYSIILALAIAFAVTSLVTAAISARISSPINKLKDHMELFQKGDFHTKINVQGQKEIVILGDAFNLMIDEIRELMNEVLKEQKAKRKTQFIALQNQINPHFLYNTLDSIVWLSENNLNEDVEKMVIALSKFFRISISNETNLISLKEEVEHAKNYLLIQQIRYHNDFTFEFKIDQDILEYSVLKLSLQPLVENAIYHGISPNDDFRKIVVKAYKKNDFIVIDVINEGYGITQDKIAEIHDSFINKHKSKSIGMKNIYQRLKLYYGESASLVVSSVLDECTTVTISIPIKKDVDVL